MQLSRAILASVSEEKLCTGLGFATRKEPFILLLEQNISLQ